MRILFCGGSELDPLYHDAAAMVGSTIIGETSHTLLFGGRKAKEPALSADQVMAKAAREALKHRGQRAEQRVVTVIPEEDRRERIFLGATRTIREADPAMRRTVMVGSADLVISVGGKYGTSSILNEAHRLRKPYLPLAFTGDASFSAWEYQKRGIMEALGLNGDDIAFVEEGSEPRSRHLLRIIKRVSGSGKQRLRLLIVSPGDVAEERDLAAEVVRELNDGIAHVLALDIDVGRWETDTHPGFHVEGPQGIVDELLKIEDSDVVVGIFGTRFGTPTHHAGSGTEHEIRTALDAWSATRRPEVMVYFRSVPQPPELHAFRQELEQSGLVGSYDHPADFERRLRRDLTTYLRTRFFS